MSMSMDWRGDEALRLLLEGIADGVQDAAEYLLEESNSEVPVDDADLRRSGKVSTDRATATAAVSYNTPYTVLRHESGYANLQNGRKKFLEIPFLSKRREMLALIQAGVRRRL